jgi:hypothetical protein
VAEPPHHHVELLEYLFVGRAQRSGSGGEVLKRGGDGGGGEQLR